MSEWEVVEPDGPVTPIVSDEWEVIDMPKAPVTAWDKATAFLNSLGHGVTFGLDDVVEAGLTKGARSLGVPTKVGDFALLSTDLPAGSSYADELRALKAKRATMDEAAPTATLGGKIIGDMAQAAIPAARMKPVVTALLGGTAQGVAESDALPNAIDGTGGKLQVLKDAALQGGLNTAAAKVGGKLVNSDIGQRGVSAGLGHLVFGETGISPTLGAIGGFFGRDLNFIHPGVASMTGAVESATKKLDDYARLGEFNPPRHAARDAFQESRVFKDMGQREAALNGVKQDGLTRPNFLASRHFERSMDARHRGIALREEAKAFDGTKAGVSYAAQRAFVDGVTRDDDAARFQLGLGKAGKLSVEELQALPINEQMKAHLVGQRQRGDSHYKAALWNLSRRPEMRQAFIALGSAD
jgi:hypothetical protein